MPVIINEFETVAEPPKPPEPSKHHSGSEGQSITALVAAAVLTEKMRHQMDRFERTRAH